MLLRKSILTLSILLAGQQAAFASEAVGLEQSGLSADEALLAFGEAKPIQTAALSSKEMKETEGAYYWAAPVLGYTFGGAALGAYRAYSTGGNYWQNISTGATAGFYTGLGSIGVPRLITFTLGGLGSAAVYNSW